ncbi:MAG: hypothetical protein HY236_05930 [Acidobacteria bacterium]|nr:hypothetical protein [Acidobacteriota bacterium]
MTQLAILAKRFVREREGVDLLEYSLLLGFLALAAAAIFNMAGSVKEISKINSEHLSNAAMAARNAAGS